MRAVRKSCHMAKLGGGLRPPSETSPRDALRAAGRPRAGPRASEASDLAVRAAGRPRAGPRASEASNLEIARAKPALEADHRAVCDQSWVSCPVTPTGLHSPSSPRAALFRSGGKR